MMWEVTWEWCKNCGILAPAYIMVEKKDRQILKCLRCTARYIRYRSYYGR